MKLPGGVTGKAVIAGVVTALVVGLVMAYAQRKSPTLRAWLSPTPTP